MLQACLNGNRTKEEHPSVPCSPAELVTDAQAAVQAGAQQLHLHPRGADGLETLQPTEIAAALLAVRASVPGVSIGISTHAGIPPHGRPLAAWLRTWSVRPDYISVNLHETAARELLRAAAECGIGVEVGLNSVAAAERFVRLPQQGNWVRVLIELEEPELDEALPVAQAIITLLNQAKNRLPRLLHGYDTTMWPLLVAAQAMGLSTRIGLEDGLILPDMRRTSGNEELVRAAATMVS